MSDLAAWPALVLTAGLGTRLQPLSHVRAKPAVPVGGEALVRRTLKWLRAAGIRRVVLNLHHLPQTITPHVGDGSDIGLEVRYSWESTLLGSAGGPHRALPLLDADRFLIVNGDTIADVALPALARQHVDTGALVTLAATDGHARYGGVDVDADNVVHGFSTRRARAAAADAAGPSPPGLHFVGVQAVERLAFAAVPDDVAAESVAWLYPRLIAERPGSVRAHRTDAAFYDIGTPADYRSTVRRLTGGASQTGHDVRIDPAATVTGSILWDRVRVGPGARLTDCVVADDVVIPAGAQYDSQAIVAAGGTVLAVPIRPTGA